MEKDEIKPTRVIKKNHTSLTGKVSNSEGRLNSFESSLERDFILITNFDPNVERFIEQPVRIEYFDEGKLRHYTPDFLIFYRNNDENQPYYKPRLIEIKYLDKLRKDKTLLKPKFDAAWDYCEVKGWEFKVLTENDIRSDFLFNAKFLSGYLNSDEVKIEDIDYLIERLGELNYATPTELIENYSNNKVKKAHLLFTIWYMVANHLIGADLSNRLTMKSEIWKKI